MSKTLGFLEISRLADDHASRDPFLCQLIIEASAEEQANGPSDAFKERFTYWNREVHLGDVIEAIGHPEKTIKGRVSLHIQHIKVVSLCTSSKNPNPPVSTSNRPARWFLLFVV